MKRLLLVAVAVLSVAACDHDRTAPVNPLVGTYVAQTINEKAPPVVVQSDTVGDTLTMLHAKLVLRADSSFSEIWTYNVAMMGFPPYVAADTLLGYYTQSGVYLHMSSQYGPYDIVTNGKLLDEEVAGLFVLEYKKQ